MCRWFDSGFGHYGALAQVVEHLTFNQVVRGSSPRCLTLVLGACGMTMGISSIILMKNMPAVILSIILGTVIGLIIHFGKLIQKMGMGMEKVISKVIPGQNKTDEEFPIADMIPAMVLVMPLSHLWVTYVMPFVS